MISLHSRSNVPIRPITLDGSIVCRVTTNPETPKPLRSKFILKWDGDWDNIPDGFGLSLLSKANDPEKLPLLSNTLQLSPDLNHLIDGDVIKFEPKTNAINVLYRRKANANSFLLTERCNSFCIMCSQPPRDIDDSYLVDDILRAIPLIPKDAIEIGFTGGETTLVGKSFFRLIEAAKTHLPNTALHILSNGRNFKDLSLAIRLAQTKHPDLMVGIPLYADTSQRHDYIVQADNAFDETIRGILNLKRCKQQVEIRVVIHKENYDRLPKLAQFITRNLLFVDHVALMGMEVTGFAKSNFDALWIDPYEYREQLAEAVEHLHSYGIRTSIYNHPLCLVPEQVRRFAVPSISDWKNDYLEACEACSVRRICGGFFTWNLKSASKYIARI